MKKPATRAVPSNSKFLSSNVKFWPFTISNRFLCIRRNSYPIFFLSTLSQIKWTKSKTLLCIVIEIGKVMRDLLFWYQMYLYSRFIRLCRCSFGSWCICNPLIFAVVDALLGTNVSATCSSLNLQMLFSLSIMYNCICILPFLGFKDTPFANFASTSHIFDNVKMLPSKITHLQLAFSMLCGCSPSKFCIFNPLESTIADIVARYPLSSIYFTTWANTLLTKKLI